MRPFRALLSPPSDPGRRSSGSIKTPKHNLVSDEFDSDDKVFGSSIPTGSAEKDKLGWFRRLRREARSTSDLTPRSSTMHQIAQGSQKAASGNTAFVEHEQSTTLSRRTEHFNKLKEILVKKLEEDELHIVFPHHYSSSIRPSNEGSGLATKPSDAQTIVDNVVYSLKAVIVKKATDKTKRVLVALEKAAKIGDVAIQHHPDVIALVWAGLRLVLQVAIDDMEFRQLMEDNMEIIARALETCGFYDTIYIASKDKPVARLGDVIAELYAAVVVFCIRAKKYVGKPNIGESAIRTLTSVNTKLRLLADEISAKERILHDFANMANTKDQQERLQELQSRTEEIQNDQKATIEALQLVLTEQQKEILRETRIWLGGLGNDLEYKRNRKLHTTGTCQWILDNELFKTWTIGELNILLICGIPGSGKSVLQSFLIHILEEQHSKDSQTYGPILYFFFKNGNSKTESPVTMMATLIDQLIQEHKCPQFVDLLNSARHDSNTNHCEDFEQLWNLFMKLVNAYNGHGPRISILIDALDECGDRNICLEFLQYIASELDWKALGVNFLLASRPEDSIMEALTPCSRVIKLSEEKVNEDIVYFVEGQINNKIYRRLEKFKDQLIETLPKKAQGMFRYAALMLEELIKPSTKDMKEILDSIPPGLNNMYIWILEHLSSDPKDLLLRKTVFTWVALAFQPISVDQMALAYAACDHDSSQTEFDPTKKILVDEQRILRACGPLVEVSKEFWGEKYITFSHFSVKEFLLITPEERDKKNPYNSASELVSSCLIHDIGIAHGSILKTCMTQLLSNTFLDTLTRAERQTIYSVHYWFKHATRSDVQLLHSTDLQRKEKIINPWPAVCEFLSDSNPTFLTWIECYPSSLWSLRNMLLSRIEHRENCQIAVNRIHVIAAFGLEIPLKKVIESPELRTDLNIADINGSSALAYAARGGHTEIISLLLKAGAEVDSKDKDQKTSLSYAAAYGHTEVVKLLIEADAKVNSKDTEQKTPLFYAAEGDDMEAVKLLIEAGAEVDSKDKGQRTPLFYAIVFGSMEAVKLLLKAGAKFDSKDEDQRTPLSYAVDRYRGTEVVKLLIEAGADVYSKDRYQRTPLCYAAICGHIEVVKLLLEAGSEFDGKDKDQKTPLSYAAQYRHTEPVKLLLEAGAKFDSKDKNENTPLIYLALNGCTEIVKLLLEGGAEVDRKDKHQRTLLSYVAQYRCTEVGKLLIEAGADVNIKDKDQITPLFYAVRAGSMEIVKLLIEAGAEVDRKDNDQRTPLSYAAEYGRTEVVKFLIEAGAGVDSKDKNQKTPLCYAAQSLPYAVKGNTEIVKLLLEAGAEVDSKDKGQRTPLIYAARKGYTEIVKLLVQSGAEPEGKG